MQGDSQNHNNFDEARVRQHDRRSRPTPSGRLTTRFAKLFKVSATNEVAEMYTLNGTYIVTVSTTGTLLVIDGGKVVFYLDCSLGTGFFTLAASDTTVEANLTHLRALIVTRALNDNS